MDSENLKLLATQNLNINIDSFIVNVIISIILSLLVQRFYIKFSTTLSNREEFSKNFIILGATTTIIITIVKSSLALSLGLVGALSIVRFRAAIKEPEELVYLFLIISIGLGCGSGQVAIVSTGVLVILIIIFLIFKIKDTKKKYSLDEKLNFSVIHNYKTNEEDIEDLKKLLLQNSLSVKLISLVKTEISTTINFQLQLENFNELNKLVNLIQKKDVKVVVAQSDIITI
jgi:hypothetical protein